MTSHGVQAAGLQACQERRLSRWTPQTCVPPYAGAEVRHTDGRLLHRPGGRHREVTLTCHLAICSWPPVPNPVPQVTSLNTRPCRCYMTLSMCHLFPLSHLASHYDILLSDGGLVPNPRSTQPWRLGVWATPKGMGFLLSLATLIFKTSFSIKHQSQ